MQRRTRQEKRIPSHVLTLLTQLLEIPHLADGSAPVHKQPLMQAPAVGEFRGPRLKRNVICDGGGEMAVVEPARGFLAGLKTYRDAVVTST